MQGPAKLVRSGDISGFEYVAPIHEWTEGKAYLLVDKVAYRGKVGAIFTYHNPPVHQIGNPALAAYLNGFEAMEPLEAELFFVILHGSCDPVQAGGDLKESLGRLQETHDKRAALEAAGAGGAEIDALYAWGDARLERGFALYQTVRKWANRMQTVAVCGGGTRFGGSAEVPLMADLLVGDSRSAMCFSESQIGLIPGWGGVGRAVTKAGLENARTMAATCRVVTARDLHAIGIYNEVVDIEDPLPRKARTEDPEADQADYLAALQRNNDEAGAALLEAALRLATAADAVTLLEPIRRRPLASAEETALEITRRRNPDTYKALWGRSLREAKAPLAELGRPLAPQSIEKLETLLGSVDMGSWDEEAFIRAESQADAELYRDPRFMEGILATLEQRVADFREAK